MKYSFQKLSIEYINQITGIIADAIKNDFPMYKKETNRSYLQVFDKEFFTKYLTNDKKHVFGAFSDNVLSGLICFKEDDGGVIFIQWLVVRKEFRQKGVGTFLLKEFEKWALEHKYHYAYLMTESDENISFYTKRGFRYIGKHPNSWFGELEHEMGKSLRNKPFQEVFRTN